MRRLPFTVLLSPITSKPKPKALFVEVAPAVPLSAGSRQVFTYRAPAQGSLGSVVRVPFGGRSVLGVVVGLPATPPPFRTKSAAPILDLALSPQQIEFARWISSTLMGGLGYTLRLFLPPLLKRPSAPLSATWRRSGKGVLPPARRLALVDSRPKQRRAAVKRLISAALSDDEAQVLVLVPEKSFLESWEPWPTVHAALPARRLSAISAGVAKGSLRVVVGTQKALFLPFQKLSLILLSESQLPTHKLWDQYPRLDSRDAAAALAKIHGASLAHDNSFPSAGLWVGAAAGEIKLVEPMQLPRLHPDVHTFTSSDYKHKNALPLSLLERLQRWSRSKQKTLVLYNRVGQPFEKLQRALRESIKAPSKNIVLATSSVFAEESPRFDHVVWVQPELTLTFPDFRSVESGLTLLARLQQLVPARERVVVATRDYNLAQLLRHIDVEKMLNEIVSERKKLLYPPFTDLVRLDIVGKTPNKAKKRALEVRKEIEQRLGTTPEVSRSDSSGVAKRGPDSTRRVESGSFPRLFGPYPSSGKPQYNLLLSGALNSLVSLYQDLPIDRVDLSPKDIL